METGDGGIPLSFAQEQMWFLDLLHSGATHYLMQRAFRLRGPLDVEALSHALTAVAERHEVLRTRYETVDGTAIQVIDDPQPVELTVRDLTKDPSDSRERLVQEIVATDLDTPIDVRTMTPWRVTVIRLSPADWVLSITIHHIAFDGWSWDVLIRELGVLYRAYATASPVPLAPLAVQYADFALWQRKSWNSSAALMEKQLTYWRDRLAGLSPLELPTDRRRPTRWKADGGSIDVSIPDAVVRQLAVVARTRNATPFMVYLAAFQLLLSRYSGQSDVAVGVSVAGRTQVELEQLIGLFLNTVVMRTDLSGASSFEELLDRVRDTTLDAYGHQEVPFERVVAELAPERDLSRNPLFQVGFALYNTRQESLTLPGLDVERFSTIATSSAFDLSLHLVERPDGSLVGRMMYPTALFNRSRIERMAANYRHLLVSIAADPRRPVTRLELIADPERERLLAWNRTTLPFDTPDKCLPALFAAAARRTPHAPAVVAADRVLSYAELAARVNSLASCLRTMGVTAETPVGVAMERGVELVTALIAVLSAGGVYVPLPPDHPTERLSLMIADAGIRIVLTQEALRSRLPGAEQVVAVDTRWEELTDRAAPSDLPPIDAAQAAYVMYTSGSTGRPKGVMITHDGIRNRVLWSVDRYGLGPADRILQKTTIGFDASMWEFLAPLVSGGTVVMAPRDAHRDPAVMVRAVVEHGVTVLQLVPSVLRLLVQEPGLADCTTLRLVCSAGEPLPAALCERLTSRVNCDVFNTYGPTECSIDSTAWPYVPGEAAESAPIGTPLSNIRVFVVDGEAQLTPIGVPGELCVAGVGVARGYLGRGDLTADRFMPNPFAHEPGERWYRTGDLARWRDDGTLEFAGRVDDQVKIRGVRVEPGEIETALTAHPAVTAATVTTHRPVTGDVELVAYVVPADDTPPQPDELRDHLSLRLPAALVPSVITYLDALPLTPNGKVDRAALPVPGDVRSAGTNGHIPPRTPTEQTIAEIMSDVLGVDPVGLEDDFFALGGHSLLAIRLVLKLRRAFDLELTVGELFDRRTVRELAALVDAGTTPSQPAIQPVPRNRPLPLSFAQQRMWFLDQLEPDSVEYLVPLALRLHGTLDVEALRHAADEVARRHEVLRTRYIGVQGEPVQIVDPPGPATFRLIDLTDAPDASAKGRKLLDHASSTPFDLEREHQLRVTLIRTAPDEHLIAITLHHIVFDAWSMGIFLRDLVASYDAFAEGRPSPLRPAQLQYADFAAWQRERQPGHELIGQLDYWREQLAGLTPVELTFDRPRPAQRDPRGDTVMVDVPEELASAVANLGDRNGTTLFMTLLAAFQVLLARYTGRTDIAVGTPVAGRTRQETEELVGFFVNNLVMRGDLSGDPSFSEILPQVRQTVLDAFANQDVPFEHLVDALRPDRDLSRNPLFQIMFEVQHLAPLPAALGSASVEPLTSGTPVAKFDLTLSVQQRTNGRLRLVFEYAAGLFDRTTIHRMASHYLQLLASVVDDPDTAIAELNLLTETERQQILEQWPSSAGRRLPHLDPPAEWHLCVPTLFERQVQRTPDAVAVVFGEQRLTYRELNRRANQLAHHLRTMGIRPETIVGSCLERGTEAVVALLAVLKAGGVYVPFDPQHPVERLNFMLADANAQVVLTTRNFADRLSDDRRVVVVDGEEPTSAHQPETDPAPLVQPNNLAYIIYTSGSTGRPKGVMIEHRSYVHHCRVIADAYDISPDDRVVLLSALTFDVAMDQIAATLLAGAAIVVSDPVFWAPAELAERLAEHQVTIVEITPAYYRELLQFDVECLSQLKLMNVGSDVVTVSDARRWAATGLPARFLCNYGPTEATVTCLLHPVAGELVGHREEAALPLGRPVAGTRAYVLDAALRPAPIGVPGELCLGGVRLARGYHDRPGLTAERFIPDPFSSAPGARLYRTGDLVRYRPDGKVEFLGRIDQQVKVRGYRIELGEIEAALVRHPTVQAAVVVARHVGPGERQLVAYLVCPPDARLDVSELCDHLRGLLPEYMIPAIWMPLATLPLTSSKKIDRAALPDPVLDHGMRTYVAPRNPGEEAIARIWTDVLGIEQIGATDNFFELGGHSLHATRVLAHLQQTFAVELPLRRLFEATSVASLANVVTETIQAQIELLSDDEVEELLSEDGRRG
ncbi:non-ribosomal peptide synthetase [Micromonospora sp. NBRC 101691]|uniref:non-ribosomal peptide synthetase n=1 Tax=Micromonospora sp. NBRC 101691 TaxID=3032198 RepID=UPI00249FD059|nr:non-ribosomal peptide synthetase [Micromonospora sp. NBRC 101691]GLY26187.1 hypothetical protein Misp04_59180 [Micromonospora sp. NBRC 101691]